MKTAKIILFFLFSFLINSKRIVKSLLFSKYQERELSYIRSYKNKLKLKRNSEIFENETNGLLNKNLKRGNLLKKQKELLQKKNEQANQNEESDQNEINFKKIGEDDFTKTKNEINKRTKEVSEVISQEDFEKQNENKKKENSEESPENISPQKDTENIINLTNIITKEDSEIFKDQKKLNNIKEEESLEEENSEKKKIILDTDIQEATSLIEEKNKSLKKNEENLSEKKEEDISLKKIDGNLIEEIRRKTPEELKKEKDLENEKEEEIPIIDFEPVDEMTKKKLEHSKGNDAKTVVLNDYDNQKQNNEANFDNVFIKTVFFVFFGFFL